MAGGMIMGLIAQDKEKSLQRKQEAEIRNMPKYQINAEAYQNQAIARQQAYGRDTATQIQEAQVEQDAADAAFQAAGVTSSTNSLMATLAAINAGKSTARRELAAQEATLQGQRKGQLINVNNQMIDEKDKAWNYNINMPYQMRIAQLREQIKHQQELQLAGVAYEAQTSSSFMGSMGGMMGGGG
jgi:hypothetical protein